MVFSSMASQLDLGDPALWSVDQLIQTLCHTEFSNWYGSGQNVPVPRPDDVEKAFRENDIDGDVFLQLDISDLRSMDLKSIGQINKLHRLIKFLRNRSETYVAHHGREASTTLSRTVEKSSSIQPEALAYNTVRKEMPVDDAHLTGPLPHMRALLPGPSSQIGDTSRTPNVSALTASQPGHFEKQEHSILDILSDNVEAQHSLVTNDATDAVNAATALPSTSKRRGVDLEIPMPKRQRVPDNVEQSQNVTSMRIVPTAPTVNIPELPSEPVSELIPNFLQNTAAESPQNSQSGAQSQDDFGPYQELLERYPPNEEDELLPLYGDSDEEYLEVTDDSSTSELEDSEYTASGRLQKIKIDMIIMEAEQEFRRDWKMRKMAFVHKRAYNQWMATAHSEESRQRILSLTTKNLDHIRQRLSGLKEAIHHSAWSKSEDVRKQCDCLQATIDQEEDYEYCLRILEEQQRPATPTRATKPVPRPAKLHVSSEDILCESDDDSLAGFVSEDTENETSEELSAEHDTEVSANDHSESESLQSIAAATNTMPGDRFSLNSKELEPTDRLGEVGEPAMKRNPTIHNLSETPRTPRKPKFVEETGADADDEDGEQPLPSSKRRSIARSSAAIQGRIRNPLSLPASESGDSETDSDPIRSPTRFRGKFQQHGRSNDEPIVLTSSPNSPEMDLDKDDHEIRTPELNPTKLKQDTAESFTRLNSSAEGRRKPFKLVVPNLDDIRRIPWKTLSEDPDAHSLALAKSISEMDNSHSEALLQFLLRRTLTDVEDILEDGIAALKSDWDLKINAVEESKQQVAMLLTLCFMSYAGVEKIVEDEISEADCDFAMQILINECPHFHELIVLLLRQQVNASRKLDFSMRKFGTGDTTGDDTSMSNGTDFDSDGLPKPRRRPAQRRRSSAIEGNHMTKDYTIDTQRMAKRRVADQEARKKMIIHKLASQTQPGDSVQIPINYKEPVILLDQHIAARIKPHQVQGVQFIWRELIADDDHQGCLLAHTMGLGKTMQVIAVLVTIAQCNRSDNPSIRDQIPPRLRDLRILILSPPALCENWFDELLFWMPEHDTLGPICKITSRTKQPYYDIKQWSESSGVLLIGYDRLVSYTKTPTRSSSETDEQYSSRLSQSQDMTRWLLELPSLVVADEAHMLKNPTAKRAETAMNIKSESRIALTGSPLSNHLEEYWAMINFIAPGYLGDITKFKKKFVDPINRCLSSDSGPFDRRLGLKKMHVLRKILDPKVNRADITAIQNDLPPKTEFFIVVPLTDIQLEMYKVCVDYFRGISADWGQSKGKTASLWQWISVLSLLCNHPWTFERKLKDPQRKSKARQAMARETEGYYDDDVGFQTHVADDVDFSDQPTMLQVMKLALGSAHSQLQQYLSDLQSPRLSYRTLLVHAIVKESLKLGEKLLIFSHSLLTLDYMELVLNDLKCSFERIDGSVATDKRQRTSKEFNTGMCKAQAFLISTRAGGLGLNLFGATRVIILDYSFNPSWEEQAIGRAYRLGQKKPVFVYRFRSGGTFEDETFNQSIFKTQLFTRIIDHKAVLRKSSKIEAAKYLFDPFDPPTKDFEECKGKDPQVMDKLMEQFQCIRDIILTETFAQDISEPLTEREMQEADQEIQDEHLARTDPAAYERLQAVIGRHANIGRPSSNLGTHQPPLFNPMQHLQSLINGPPNAAIQIGSEPFLRPAVTPTATQGVRQSYDDTTVADALPPRWSDGADDKNESLEARQSMRNANQNRDAKACSTQ